MIPKWKKLEKELKQLFGDIDVKHIPGGHGVNFDMRYFALKEMTLLEVAVSDYIGDMHVIPETDWKEKEWVRVFAYPKRNWKAVDPKIAGWLPLDKKTMDILNAILQDGFRFWDSKPADMHQVLNGLIEIAKNEGFLSNRAEELADQDLENP